MPKDAKAKDEIYHPISPEEQREVVGMADIARRMESERNPQGMLKEEKLWYLGEYWEKEYSSAEADVYRSADGKKRLYVYWDGSKQVVRVESEPSTLRDEIYHSSPISEHCRRVLAEPPKCYDFRGARAFCLCWAWNEMEKKKLSRLPVGEAWQELRRVCRTE